MNRRDIGTRSLNELKSHCQRSKYFTLTIMDGSQQHSQDIFDYINFLCLFTDRTSFFDVFTSTNTKTMSTIVAVLVMVSEKYGPEYLRSTALLYPFTLYISKVTFLYLTHISFPCFPNDTYPGPSSFLLVLHSGASCNPTVDGIKIRTESLETYSC